jgi:hypothetical protein
MSGRASGFSEENEMAESKTRPTGMAVTHFVASVENETRRKDATALLSLLEKVTGWEPQMWGPSIVGFGASHYTYASGRSGSICAVGFSPRKANLAFYISDFPGKDALLQRLGKHKGGIGQCLYINRLSDVDIAVLEEILRGGVAAVKKNWPVTDR